MQREEGTCPRPPETRYPAPKGPLSLAGVGVSIWVWQDEDGAPELRQDGGGLVKAMSNTAIHRARASALGRCLWTGRVGGWRAGGWECGGLLPAREPRPAGEKRVGSRSSRPTWMWRPAGQGGGAWGCGGEAGRRAESLTCPDWEWLEVPSPGPGRGQDRMEKHSSLPILSAATPTLSAHHCLLP